ncbi:hypothetical protein LX36DRAFT_711244 [Colletotrichum falcatum]|nr:hypothetical protein LX36DRAFT_711244 [Colletotrichum falcatum]
MTECRCYNIHGWATDGGKGLHDNENGCGALTGWDWEAATDTKYAQVHFYLSFFMAPGCVERAIFSAGGPKISVGGDAGADAVEDLGDGQPLASTRRDYFYALGIGLSLLGDI